MYPNFVKFNLPTWALCYLINADPSGLDDGEIALIDSWMERRGVLWACDPEEEYGPEFFDPCPEFGRACDVLPCYCAVRA